MKNDLAIFRAVEAIVALVIVIVLYGLVSTGALASLTESATGWYSQKVDGIFTLSVVDTRTQLPRLTRENLPIASAPRTEELSGVDELAGQTEAPAATDEPTELANR